MCKPLSKTPRAIDVRKFRAKQKSSPKKKKDFLKKEAAYMISYARERRKKDKVYNKTVQTYNLIGNCIQNYLRTEHLPKNSFNTKFYKKIGCSQLVFLKYLKRRFKKGMSWENYGRKGWKIEHIKDIKSFNLKNRQDFLKAFNYKNCKPCWSNFEISQKYT